MSAWIADDLNAIEGNADLFVSPFPHDGATYGTPTQTWALVVDGDVYVRAASGPIPAGTRPPSAKGPAGCASRTRNTT
jgi:hypothetical protein